APRSSQSFGAILARGRRRVSDVARSRALAPAARPGDSLGAAKFFARELFPLPRGEISKFDRTERDTMKAGDFVTDRLEEPPQFAVPAFIEIDSQMRLASGGLADGDTRRAKAFDAARARHVESMFQHSRGLAADATADRDEIAAQHAA